MDDRIKFKRIGGTGIVIDGWIDEETPEGFKIFVPDPYQTYSAFVPHNEVIEIIRGISK